MIGKTISHYQILEKLGKSVMDTVYKIRNFLMRAVQRLDENIRITMLFVGTHKELL